ncbi:hypothetical protein LRS73_22700 [Methylobacterium currus]|uniref:hypothetical protein n=1 Tax=Methylobacterium currus TaxID=2051553 RepID=UPI001E5DBD75|nr:hypothetical protein [Methylobacterium currus]UHC15304.1 hypothetical protein LRS73_22700 [Methylobacterium currus]
MLVAAKHRTFAAAPAPGGRPAECIHLATVDSGTLTHLLAQASLTPTGADPTP